MSNTTVTDSFLNTVNSIQKNVSLYGYSIIFIFGNIGSILNILILTQRNYRQNSCSCYILASTITNLFIINIVVVFRILTGFNIDPTKTSWFFCKFRTYMIQMLSILSRSYIVLACIDRWAMTSRKVAQRRALTGTKMSKTLIPLVAIGWSLSFLYVPIYQNIIRGRCVGISNSYKSFYNIYNTILSGILVPISMLIFSLLTIRNVRKLRQRADSNAVINPDHRRKFNYQLSLMILVQQGVYIITTLPFTSYLLYIIITEKKIKSNIHMGIDGLYSTFAYFLTYINYAGTFYLYTLTSKVFRKDLRRLLDSLKKFI